MADINKCQDELIILAEEQGYLTFDDIMNASDAFSLSATEVDILSESIQVLGIIVYEDVPGELVNGEEKYDDFSQIDYEKLFKVVVEEAEELGPFIKEISRIIPPQYGEISLLTQQAAAGNSFARERLILSHARIAIKVALSLSRQRNLDLADAVSAAMMGLIVGTDKFNPNGFSSFQGYISFYIKRYVERECSPIWRQFYTPVHVLEKMIQAYKLYSANKPDDDSENKDFERYIAYDIAYWMGITDEEAERLVELIKTQAFGVISLEDSEEVNSLEDIDFSIISRLADEELKRTMDMVLKTLTQREQKILKLRYGIEDGVPRTLEEIGSILGLTRERIRQIEKKAIRKLRHPSRSKRLKDFLDE